MSGIGTFPSPTGTGDAAFLFGAGYFRPKSNLNGSFVAVDLNAGFAMKTLTVDSYGGYHMGGGGFDRFFTGSAQITSPTFTGVMPYLIEVLDFGSNPPATGSSDFIHIAEFGYLTGTFINRGDIVIRNQDTSSPDCQ